MKRFLLDDDIFEMILDGIPSPIFIVDNDVRIYSYNKAASALFANEPGKIIKMGCGDALHCFHSAEDPKGCGGADACKKCVIRNSVDRIFHGEEVQRKKCELQITEGGKSEQVYFFVTTAPLTYKSKLFALVTLEDITELTELRGLLPICASCKKIRNDEGYWEKIEKYIYDRTDARFTHSICPDCAKDLYPF